MTADKAAQKAHTKRNLMHLRINDHFNFEVTNGDGITYRLHVDGDGLLQCDCPARVRCYHIPYAEPAARIMVKLHGLTATEIVRAVAADPSLITDWLSSNQSYAVKRAMQLSRSAQPVPKPQTSVTSHRSDRHHAPVEMLSENVPMLHIPSTEDCPRVGGIMV